MDSPTTTITPPPAYGFEARITPWVGAYPAQTFEEHAAVAAGNWTLSQWGASQSQSGGADFVIQSGVEAYLVNIAQVPRCGCSSFASPCGHAFWVYTRVLGLADNDPLVWQTSLTSAELSLILASILPATKPAAPPATAPLPLVERKRPLSATAFADSAIRRAPPTLRDSYPPRVPAPSQIQSQAYPPPPQPVQPAFVPLAPLDLSLVPPSALRGYLDHFLRRQPALLSARALDLYRPGPLEAVSDTGCYNLLLDLVLRDTYVHTTLYDAFVRPPPAPVAYPQPAPPAPAEPTYQTSLPTPPPTANPYSEPAEAHAISFGKEVNRVRQAVKFTASKRGTQVRKNFDTIAGGVCRSISATSHPQTKLNAVRSLVMMADLAVNAEGGEIHNKLMDHGSGYQGVYTCIIGIWDALEFMTLEGQRRALPEVRKFAREVLAPYGIDVSINGAIKQMERGEQVCRRTDR